MPPHRFYSVDASPPATKWYSQLPSSLGESFACGLGIGVGISLLEKYSKPVKIQIEERAERDRVIVASGEYYSFRSCKFNSRLNSKAQNPKPQRELEKGCGDMSKMPAVQ